MVGLRLIEHFVVVYVRISTEQMDRLQGNIKQEMNESELYTHHRLTWVSPHARVQSTCHHYIFAKLDTQQQ